jgi:hypothetical protein
VFRAREGRLVTVAEDSNHIWVSSHTSHSRSVNRPGSVTHLERAAGWGGPSFRPIPGKGKLRPRRRGGRSHANERLGNLKPRILGKRGAGARLNRPARVIQDQSLFLVFDPVGWRDCVHKVSQPPTPEGRPLAGDSPLMCINRTNSESFGNQNLNQIVGKSWKRLVIIATKPRTASNWHGS